MDEEMLKLVTGGCHLPNKQLLKLCLNSIYGKNSKFVDVHDLYPSIISQVKCCEYEVGIRKAIADYLRTNVENNIKMYKCGSIVQPKRRVMFNSIATILEIDDFKTVVKCHEEDKFEPYIGLGLALSRYYKKKKSTKKEFETLEYYITKYTDLAEVALWKYCNYDSKQLEDLLTKICDFEKGKWLDI